MARKIVSRGTATPQTGGRAITVQHDPVSEAVVIASCAQDHQVLKTHIRRLRADHFLVREHSEIWAAFITLERRGLDPTDIEALERVAGPKLATVLNELVQTREGVATNLAWHVENVVWDKIRAEAVKGPIASLVEATRDPMMERERLRALARQVSTAFDGGADREFILDTSTMIRDNMAELERQITGDELRLFELPGIDFFEEGHALAGCRRLTIGTELGMMTVITSSSGAGKTTTAANLAIGQAAAKIRTLYCAWEMQGRVTLKILAGMKLGWRRADLMDPRHAPNDSPIFTKEGRILLEETQHDLGKYVIFVRNPFRKRINEKSSNERNQDIIHQIIADAGCQLVIFDLWKRCLAPGKSRPEDEEDALLRQQAMGEELNVHQILLQQQRLKDIEMRPDKRPTREGIKGSGSWIECPDCIIGVHRPALWKNIVDDRIEFDILKQRYGPWPLAVECDFNPVTGIVSGGRTIDYVRPGEVSEFDSGSGMGKFLQGGKKRR